MRRLKFLLPVITTLLFLAWTLPVQAEEREIREYQGKPLAPFDREYANSIRGPQTVATESYRLKVTGLVKTPLALTYQEVLALPSHRRGITLNCVEGWDEHLLFEGVRLAELLKMAGVKPEAKTVIFFAADDYSSSLPLKYVLEKDILLAARINGRVLDAKRGFPFQGGGGIQVRLQVGSSGSRASSCTASPTGDIGKNSVTTTRRTWRSRRIFEV